MPLVASKKPLNATYRSDLTGPARVRYAEKVRLCDNEDPFMLRPGMDTAGDVDLFPEISYGDILNYLVFSANFLTLEEMKAFKSTEAHNYFTSGWVKSLSAKQLQDDKVLLLGEVSSRDLFYYFVGSEILHGMLEIETVALEQLFAVAGYVLRHDQQ